ncbi:GDSL lipase/esterase [Dichomitus squalens]|uniref:GDSL lipase/esterase n=1 Tax=Dichomitus squalens TaxID=114155 RepID=A0A4V2K670_9APHY|nr:GDSL lipase/esterase [Dichomitus squalens]
MTMSLGRSAWLIAFVGVVALKVVTARITDIVLFGDSYTDQSRAHSIANGTYPGKDYKEVYPPADTAADGGFQWPFYLGLYGNYTIWNYAVGGAVCSNKLTPLSDIPDVSSGQQAWFVQDHVVRNGTSHQKLLLDPASFIVIIFVGTNDVGVNSFVTNDQGTNVSLPNVADCQLDTLRQLHALGARQFIVNSLVPLQLTRLYSDSSDPTIYYPSPPHNGTVWHRTIFNLVHSLNRILRDGVRTLDTEWGGGGSVQWFDTYGFFEEMYNHPARYFNGSVPANVTGQCHQCPDPDDWRQCGIGDCTPDERDSYMWWDELHPSEQTGRNLAAEMHRKIEGKSKY